MPQLSMVQLDVSGMTCASCAARIEKKLNRIDGVRATVNYATEKATVQVGGQTNPDELIAAIEKAGYGATLPTETERDPEAEVGALRRRLVISAALSLPVILLSMVPAWQFAGWQWFCFALSVPVVAWGAWPFHRAALLNLRHGTATMDTLISLGSLAAFGWSAYALAFGPAGEIGFTHAFELTLMRGHATSGLYLEAAVAITSFLLLGRFLEARAKRRSGAALRALLELTPGQVSVLREGQELLIDSAALRVGEQFVVRPGERIATDGAVVSGDSAVDASSVTGESIPVEVGPGDPVVGGCVNTHGRLIVEAQRIGADTQLAQIARLVEAAQSGKAAVQRLADRVAAVFVPVVIALALLTLGFWLWQGAGADFAVTTAVAVLIIACPCALGLATPTALLVGTGRGAQLGIVIKGPEVLERTGGLDVVVLDKTGTVTSGRMRVTEVVAHGVAEPELLRRAGAAESGSEHPIARAIAEEARAGGPLLPLDALANRPGAGIVASLGVDTVVVGRLDLLEAEGLEIDAEVRASYARIQAGGATAVAVGWAGRAFGVIGVADTAKPEAAEAIARLRALGLRPVLLTGDHVAAAQAVAAEVGIDEVLAEVRPADKAEQVARLQEAGHRVVMIGDGVNDAAALAQADLGIAMGSGTDAAIEASDLTLMRSDLRLTADAIRLARRTLRTIKGNLVWAFGYNVAALPLAMAGLLNPMIAAAAMAFSSVFVVGNSLRLLSFRPKDTP